MGLFSWGSGKSSSSNSSNFNQQIAPVQIPALQNLYASAGNLFNSQNFSGYNPMAAQLQPWMFQQAQMAQPAYQSQLSGGIQDPNLTRQFNAFMDSPSNASKVYADIMGGSSNSYVDPVINNLRRDMQINLDRGAMRDQGTAYNALGRAGSDRNTVENALLQAENDRNFGTLASNLRMQGHDSDVGWKMGIAEQADANKLAALGMGFDNLNQRNANQSNAFNLGGMMQNLGMGMFAPMMMAQQAPWDMMMNYSNVIGPPTTLTSGSSYGKGSAKETSWGLL